MKTYLPDEYFKKVGYQALPEDYSLCAQGNGIVTGQIRTDALGQRVRERFNEDLTYDEKASTVSSKRLRLKTKLGQDDARSNASSAFRVRSIASRSQARALSQVSGVSRPMMMHQKEHPADELTKAQNIIEKVLGEESLIGEDPYQNQEQQAGAEDEQIPADDNNDEADKPSVVSSQRNYLGRLENALIEERARRNMLELEVQEARQINKEIASKLGM